MKKKFKDSKILSGNYLRQLFFIMKLTIFFLITSALGLFATGSYSQNTRVSLELSSVTVKEALKAIENKSEFFFIYNNELINVERVIDLNVKDQKIAEVLKVIFDGVDVEIAVIDRKIVLAPAFMGEQQAGKKVAGKVTDTSGATLPGVSVIVKGTTTGVITDSNGSYSLSNVPENATLQFSFVGMKAQEITVGNKSAINITLEEESIGIEEVVAVGYGTQKKKTLTGAITNIGSKEILTTVSSSVAQKLQGKVAGLNIRQTSAEPGSMENSINIRGFGTPVYVIDGIARGDGKDFQRLNAEDIENISILKDASAAIYGLNAANGVVIVTTKRGTEGKTKFNFNSTTGFSQPVSGVRMMNAAEYVTAINEAKINEGASAPYSAEILNKWQTGAPGYEGTNWMDESFNEWAPRHEYNVSASGGNKGISFFVSGGLIDEGSILLNDVLKYKRFNFRSNVTAKLTENLTVNVNIGGIIDKKTEPNIGGTNSGDPTNPPTVTDGFNSATNYMPAVFNIWRGAVGALPIRTIYANNNPLYPQRINDGGGLNPVALQDPDRNGYNLMDNSTVQSTADLTYKAPFLKGLEFKGLVSYDYRIAMVKTLYKNYLMYDYNSAKDSYVPTAFNNPPFLMNDWNYSHYLTLQAQASYKATFAAKHNFSGTFVFEKKDQGGRYQNLQMEYAFYTNDQISQASKTHVTPTGNEWQVRSMSYLGRFTYDYKGKYLFEFAGRYDGSYRYAPDVRWGFFPVVSAGWRISDENFLKDNIKSISNLKLRGSIGQIGQDAGNPFQFIPGFSTTGGGNYEFDNGTLTYGAATPAMVNPKLTWTISNILDIGVDLGLFENKLSITADVYQRDRTGLLAYRNVTIPNTFGGTFPQENLNSDRVKGIEFSLLYKNNIGKFNYNIGGNVNFSRTMNQYVESSPFTSSWQKYTTGASNRWADIMWGYDLIGQFQTKQDLQTAPIQSGSIGNSKGLPGDFKYADSNGDGVINVDDQKPLFHNTTPTTNFGLTLGGTYKNFDFNLLFQGSAGNTVQYRLMYQLEGWAGSNMPAYFLDRYQIADPSNPSTTSWIPGAWPTIRLHDDGFSGSNINVSSAWRRSADYVRLKNIELGYMIRSSFLSKIKIDKVRVACNMTNVYTWANSFVKAFDPESVSGFVNAGWNYPQNRTINLAINVDF